MTIQTGYKIADISTLQALTSSQRTDGYARFVESDANARPSWYMFIASSAAAADGDLVIMPSDNPSNGRWHKSGAAASSTVEFAGSVVCTSSCAVGGKVFEFYAPQSNLPLVVVPSFNISITPGSDSIQLHRWNQQPNTSLSGREFVTAIANTGSECVVTIDSTYRWISFFARNPAKSGQYCGTCFVVNGNACTLLGFSQS